MKVLIKNQQKLTKIKRDSAALLRLLGLKDAELSILFVNDGRMKELNHKYRGIDRTTDVLSFPQQERSAFSVQRSATFNFQLSTFNFMLGDIVINLQAAKRQAPEHGLSFNEELRWLLVHGVLHLIGYDHERSKYAERKMRTKERELLEYISKL
ncbi:MAG: rRNA maturation RNase YbeY [Nitrospirae bacterium]|nr:rRNA maturation RNase YbeY [Nitrospirota bacterium]MBI3378465.1 rRNA maturation RNase YbeY [Nitrospirota bacterium]